MTDIYYKFRALNHFTLSALIEDKIYLSSPDKFNDPLDCNPSIEVDSTFDQLQELICFFIENQVKTDAANHFKNLKIKRDKSEKWIKKLASNAVEEFLYDFNLDASNEKNEQSKIQSIYTNYIKNHILKDAKCGVFSLSKSYKNTLMWSHYADEHKGICVGYSTRREPIPVPQKVIYTTKRSLPTSLIYNALMKKDADAQKLLQDKILLSKAPPWKYEHEYRLVGNTGLQGSPFLLTEIIFGFRCSDIEKFSLITLLSQRKCEPMINFYEMRLTSKYHLKRHFVDTDELKRIYPAVAESGEEMFKCFDFQESN